MAERHIARATTVDAVDDVALCVLHHVGHEAAFLARDLSVTAGHAGEVRDALTRFSFNRFTNWGLSVGDDAQQSETWSQSANWFLHRYRPEQHEEFERRLAGLDRELLFQFIDGFCRERYGQKVRSILAFGGYLYGVTLQPDDLDLIVVVENSHAVENDVAVRCRPLSDMIRYPRRPDDKIGLTVVGANQVNASTHNNTVLRTAIIAGTTGVSLFGPPYQRTPVPVSVMLYHAIELVTWGFKLSFETTPQAHARALWRLVEGAHILQFIGDIVGTHLFDREHHIAALERHIGQDKEHEELATPRLFTAGCEEFRQDAIQLKRIIRSKAIALFDAFCRR